MKETRVNEGDKNHFSNGNFNEECRTIFEELDGWDEDWSFFKKLIKIYDWENVQYFGDYSWRQ